MLVIVGRGEVTAGPHGTAAVGLETEKGCVRSRRDGTCIHKHGAYTLCADRERIYSPCTLVLQVNNVLRMSFVPEQEAQNFDRQVLTFWSRLMHRDITSQLSFLPLPAAGYILFLCLRVPATRFCTQPLSVSRPLQLCHVALL